MLEGTIRQVRPLGAEVPLLKVNYPRSEGTEYQKYVEQGAHLKELPKAANKKGWKKEHG